MKRTTIILMLLTAHYYALSQHYEPVITNDSISWDIATWELFGIHMFKLHTQKHPDSTYAELYSDIYSIQGENMGKIREDINTGRLWYLSPFYPEEILIMDMTLNVGDTFQIMPWQWSTVDSIFYYNDRKIIRFDHDAQGWNEKIMFIEGIGPNISVVYRFDYFIPFYATCKHHNLELVYVNSNSLFVGCLPDPTGIDTPDKIADFYLYPNPCNDLLYIQINSSLLPRSELHIIDVTGRIIKNIQLTGFYHTVDLRRLSKGIHIIRITNGNFIFNHKLLLTK